MSRQRSARHRRASQARVGLLGTRARKAAAAAAATVAALASLASVLQFVDNTVTPSRNSTDRAASAKEAEIRSVKLTDAGEPLTDFVQKVHPTDDRDYTNDELGRRGYEFLLSLVAEGPEGTRLRLRWMLYDERRRRVPGAAYSQIASDFKTSATKQAVRWPVWVPYPSAPGRYFVRFILENDEHRPVDQIDSERFDHR